jgi:peptidoglycan/xylan/chitin deacetylase (PgdA/CDA1 family)
MRSNETPARAARVNLWSIAVPAAGIAAGVAAWGAVHPTSEIFGPTIHHTRRHREIALTFDDGPNPAITPQLLALLERHSVAASFFVVGQFARACPELVREIAARGHALGNHTETHPNLALLSGARIEGELGRCRESIAETLAGGASAAKAVRWMRPPFGYRGPQLQGAVCRAGLRGVAMWSLMCYDWKPQPLARLIERLGRVAAHSGAYKKGAHSGVHKNGASGAVRARRGGDVVLLHDGDYRSLGADQTHVLAVLEHWLPRWRDAGLEFVTMDRAAGAMPATT